MDPLPVVVRKRPCQDLLGLLDARKLVRSDVLALECPVERLDVPVLLRGVLPDELVHYAKLLYGSHELAAAVLQAIVRPEAEARRRGTAGSRDRPEDRLDRRACRGNSVKQVRQPLPGKHVKHVDAAAPPVGAAVDVGDVRLPELAWPFRPERLAPGCPDCIIFALFGLNPTHFAAGSLYFLAVCGRSRLSRYLGRHAARPVGGAL